MAAIAEGEADFGAGNASRYIEQHGEWFHDQESRQADKKGDA